MVLCGFVRNPEALLHTILTTVRVLKQQMRYANRHICIMNPAATVKAERHTVVEEDARHRPHAGPRSPEVDRRRRPGRSARPRRASGFGLHGDPRWCGHQADDEDFVTDGSQYTLRFEIRTVSNIEQRPGTGCDRLVIERRGVDNRAVHP